MSGTENAIKAEPDASAPAPGHRNVPLTFSQRLAAKMEAVERDKQLRRAEDQSGGFSNYPRILKYGTRADRLLQFFGALASVVAGAAFPLMTVVFGNVVDDFSEYFNEGSDMTPDEFMRRIDSVCRYFVYLFIGKFLLGYISTVCFRYTGTRISTVIRQEYLRSVFRQDLTFFDKLKHEPLPQSQLDLLREEDLLPPSGISKNGTPGTVAICITTIAALIQGGVGEKIGGFLQAFSLLFCGFGVAFLRNARLAAVVSLTLPAMILVQIFMIPVQLKLEKRIIAADARAADVAEEILASIRTTQSLNAHHKVEKRYKGFVELAKETGLKKAPCPAASLFFTYFIMFGSYALCFYYGVRLFRDGQIKNPGVIVTVFFAVMFGVMGFVSLTTPVQAILRAASASTPIFQTIDREPAIDALSSNGLRPGDLPLGDLELQGIKFSYPETGKREEVTILGNASTTEPERADDGLSLTFPFGKTTAIVGRSGSGKSTIVALLERWYEPQQGRILIGGVDIKYFNLRWWRSQIGLVMQEPYLFKGTIYFNVSKGLTGTKWEGESEEVKRRLVVEACTQANAADFIDRLPKKYDTEVGPQGIKLSGGQKQRIAIARSIISEPKILILDEATSAVDPKNERIVQNALDNISKGRTTIMIAHRLSTVKRADKIIVLDAGNIVESGTHQELLGRPNGAYKRLVENQTLLLGGEAGRERGADSFTDAPGFVDEPVGDRKVETTPPAAQEKRRHIGGFKCVMKILWEQRKLWYLFTLGAFGAIGAGASFPIMSVFFASLMATFAYLGDLAAFVAQGDFWSGAYLVLAAAVGAFQFLMTWMFQMISYRSGAGYRLEYFRNIVRQRIPFFDREENSAGSLTSQTSHDPAAIQELLGMSTGFSILSVVNLVGSCTLSLILGWKLSIVVICATVPLLVAAGFVRIRIEMGFVKDTMDVFSDSATFATEAVGAYRTVSSLVMEEDIGSRYEALLHGHVRRVLKRTLLASIFYSASDSLTILATALCFWYGGQLMVSSEYGLFQFFIVYMAVIQGSEAAGSFFGLTPSVAAAIRCINRMFRLREDPPAPGDAMESDKPGGGCEIEFRNVSFGYPTRGAKLFTNLNLKIKKGQFAAFVGASGCGKTTAISILERFYEVDSGEVFIDGKNVSTLDLESYRTCVALVAQEPVLYQGTVSYNVKLGVPDGTPEEAVIQACREAYIHDFISSLPEGYNTLCGSKGVGLSAGQKQRVAIARALIRNPRLLLLDEATASLDTASEQMVQRAFEDAAKGRTMVVVAHRLSTVQNADVIFVFDDGRVVEVGNHKELVAMKGVYWQMCLAQVLDN